VITAIREERLLVVSDIHLGNPLYRRRHRFVDFLRFARQNGYPVCINGDGVDIVQNSIARLRHDLRGCNREFAQFAARGLPIYYTVGNHDIVLEQFLDDWGVVRVAPFLNVDSGERRIRIEHGHIYDEMFVKYPRTYDVITVLGSAMLRVSPALFRATSILNTALVALGEWRHGSHRAADDAARLAEVIPGERPVTIRAAQEIAERGFDAVIFGHTHRAGQVELSGGAWYYNTGVWESDPYYAEIDDGRVTLRSVSSIAA